MLLLLLPGKTSWGSGGGGWVNVPLPWLESGKTPFFRKKSSAYPDDDDEVVGEDMLLIDLVPWWWWWWENGLPHECFSLDLCAL